MHYGYGKFYEKIFELFIVCKKMWRSTEGDKSVSSKSGRDKQKQQKQSEQKETPIADEQTPKSTTNAPTNRFLQCFACCACCH